MAETSSRVAYVNGEILPEEKAGLAIRDLGFVYGDAVFDTARTFGGKLFRMKEHVDRLFDSLAYARIDPGMTHAEILAAAEDICARNLPVLREGEDYWVTIRISAGVKTIDGEPAANAGPTVTMDCLPLPLRARAKFFRDGIPAAVAARRRISADALSPNVKSNNYLNMMVAQREVEAQNPGAWALLCAQNGDLAEGAGCNFFTVKNGVVTTPPTTLVLAGVSRQVVLELCADLGIEAREADLPLRAAVVADEAFFTSTSLCACPCASLNGRPYPAGAPGPVTRRIMDAFREHVGFDFEAQYLRFLGAGSGSVGL